MSDQNESPRALAAFEAYYALGPGRSLAKLAANGGPKLAQGKEWSAQFNWQERVLERQREEIEAARAAAKKEAAALARKRMRLAHIMQETGTTIIAKADIAGLDPFTARDLVGQARGLITDGIKAERDELIMSTDEDQQADLGTLRQQLIQRMAAAAPTASVRDLMQMFKLVETLYRTAPDTPSTTPLDDLAGRVADMSDDEYYAALEQAERLLRGTGSEAGAEGAD